MQRKAIVSYKRRRTVLPITRRRAVVQIRRFNSWNTLKPAGRGYVTRERRRITRIKILASTVLFSNRLQKRWKTLKRIVSRRRRYRMRKRKMRRRRRQLRRKRRVRRLRYRRRKNRIRRRRRNRRRRRRRRRRRKRRRRRRRQRRRRFAKKQRVIKVYSQGSWRMVYRRGRNLFFRSGGRTFRF